MEDILQQLKKWKEGRDEDWIYDEAHEFFAQLSRGECMEIIYFIEDNIK